MIFLQNLRVTFGSSVVLEGVTLGCSSRPRSATLTFTLHQKLPYKRLLIITGMMLLVVLFVMVGEEINEMQLAGWIEYDLDRPTGPAGSAVVLPAPERRRRSSLVARSCRARVLFPGQYLRVWRPRRHGLKAARLAGKPPLR